MHLIQILVPVFDNAGHRFGREIFEGVRAQLMERFGGLTAFVQSPALGLWKDVQSGTTAHDDMILVEVMVEMLDRDWWCAYRSELERTFRQDETSCGRWPASGSERLRAPAASPEFARRPLRDRDFRDNSSRSDPGTWTSRPVPGALSLVRRP